MSLGDGSLGSDIASVLASLDAGGEGQPELARRARSKDIASAPISGYPSLSYNDAWLEPFQYNEGQMIKFQRRLAAAGYLGVNQDGKVRVSQMGFYDQETRQAMADLLLDAQIAGYNPKSLMNYRIQLTLGQHPDIRKLAPTADGQQRAVDNAAAYEEVWKLKPTEEYLQTLQGFNPEEVKAWERAKATFKDSEVAQAEQDRLMEVLRVFFTRKD